MVRVELEVVKAMLGQAAESVSPREMEWLEKEAANIEDLSRGLAEFATGEWDFAAIVRPVEDGGDGI